MMRNFTPFIVALLMVGCGNPNDRDDFVKVPAPVATDLSYYKSSFDSAE